MTNTQHAQPNDAVSLFVPLFALMDQFDAHLAEFQEAARQGVPSTVGGMP
ncbi:hypothetical protein [Microbacterium sp.]|nr:hypothetical protein [Microbacterium sp.]